MARVLSISSLLLLLVLLAGCTVTTTFDFATPAATKASPSDESDANGKMAMQTVSIVGLYDTATNQLFNQSRWYVPDETRYVVGRLQVRSDSADSELSRLTPKLILGREVQANETITKPLNTGDNIPAWKVLMVNSTNTECEPVRNLVWRETIVDVSNPGDRTMAVMDWPVAEVCPLRNSEVSDLIGDEPLKSLWVDFMIAGDERTALYRFSPFSGEDPASVDEQTAFCEWIDCSGWAGGLACKVLRCS